MSIPSNPSISDICTEGLKKGGRVNPTASDIADTQNIHFQEVKADIYLKAPLHFSLQTVGCIPVLQNISRYSWPSNCETIDSLQLVDAPTSGAWQSTAQGGGVQSITLDSTFTVDPTNIVGRTIFLVGGTGSGQFAQITGYNDSTKVVTLEAPWASFDSTWVTPDNTTQYLIENVRYKLWEQDKAHDWDTQAAPFQQMTPFRVTLMDRQIWLNATPNRIYAMPITYWLALDQLDETSTLFLGHLRKFRSLWIQGVAAKVANRYDDARYPTLISIYDTMLDLYGAKSAEVGQVIFRDIV